MNNKTILVLIVIILLFLSSCSNLKNHCDGKDESSCTRTLFQFVFSCQPEYNNQSEFVKCNPKMDNEDSVGEKYVYYKGRKMTKTQYEEMSGLKVTCNERDWSIDSNLYEEESYWITGSKLVVKVADLKELEDIPYYIFNNESKDGQFKIILTFREMSGVKINNPILLEEVNILSNETYNGIIRRDKILELKPENANYFYLHIQKSFFQNCINLSNFSN